MNTVTFSLVGENGKLVPIIAPASIKFPSLQVKNFKTACGAGNGVGDWIVPEKVFGLRLTPACFVHDYMWDIAEPTWEYFHASNSIFLSNNISLIQCQSESEAMKCIRMYRAVTYYNAVDTIGAAIFWSKFKGVNRA